MVARHALELATGGLVRSQRPCFPCGDRGRYPRPVRLIKSRRLACGVVIFAAFGAATPSSASAVCNNGVQSITKRKSISCSEAIRVSRFFETMPECRGDVTRRRGWTARGIGRPGEGIAARVSKGSRSFVIAGGGLC